MSDKESKKIKIKSWYSNRYQIVVVQRNILLLLTIISIIAVAASVTFVKNMMSSKSLEPYVIELDEKTGIATTIQQPTSQNFTANEVMRRYFLNKYIQASKISGLKHFSYVSTSWESGTPGKRTPRLTVEYSKDVSISFYKNMCNEFTYHHKSCYNKVGLYDTMYRDPWDIDMAYRESQQDYAAPFWWFADVTGSDELIMNNPVAVSRLQGDRPDGSREERIQKEWQYFINKHGIMVNQVPDTPKEKVLEKLKKIKP